MRVVLDTNIVVSALLWHGDPYRVTQLVPSGRLELITSRELLDELADVISRQKFASRFQQTNQTVEYALNRYRNMSVLVEPAPIPPTVLADPDDDAVLACAKSGEVKYIVTEDRHLLRLRSYEGIPILLASQLLSLFSTDGEQSNQNTAS